jgi:hypothetical protein
MDRIYANCILNIAAAWAHLLRMAVLFFWLNLKHLSLHPDSGIPLCLVINEIVIYAQSVHRYI